MKNKLRKLTIAPNEYFYTITDKLENGNRKLTVKIFLKGYKATPLTIVFLTFDDNIMGNPLNTGFDLTHSTGATDNLNIHEPRYIKEILLLGIKAGWTGMNKIAVQDGIAYLNHLGYDTTPLAPHHP